VKRKEEMREEKRGNAEEEMQRKCRHSRGNARKCRHSTERTERKEEEMQKKRKCRHSTERTERRGNADTQRIAWFTDNL